MRPGTVSVSALDDLWLSVPGEVVSGIQANCNYQISEGTALPFCKSKSAGRFLHTGDYYECKCKLLRYCSVAPATGEGRILHKKRSNQDCRTDCKADWCEYKIANFLTISLSISVNCFAKKCVIPCVANRRWQHWQRHRIISRESKYSFLRYSRKRLCCGLLPIAVSVPTRRIS